MITFSSTGSFKNTERFLKRATEFDIRRILDTYGRKGVAALAGATPADSGATAASWSYEISGSKGSWSISWTNSNMAGGVPVAILLQYGHGTGTGGYVQGRDFINPAMRNIFDQIADEAWKAVTSA